MALPSQNARPIARRTHMHRRSRRQRSPRFAVVAVILAVVAVGWWWWWSRGTGGGQEGATDGTGLVTGVEEIPARDTSQPAPASSTRRPEARDTAAGGIATAKPPASATVENAAADPPPAARKPSARPRREPARSAPAAAPTTPAPAPTTTTANTSLPPRTARSESRRALRTMQLGLDLLARNEPVEARRALTEAHDSGDLDARDAATVRERLSTLGERMVFSPEVVPDDPFSLSYIIQPNDSLARIPRKMGIQVDWRFLQRINRLSDPTRIRPGQRLKLVTGPFHAIVHKHAYRLDLYLGEGPERVFVRSFAVGLGEYNSTPEGRFRVRPDSKLVNPEWRNPRTRQLYLPDDPTNPIGEHWVGLVGDEPRLSGIEGYGIHGTVEPESIGRQASMGCVRMLPEDVAIVWSVLMDGISVVEIRP